MATILVDSYSESNWDNSYVISRSDINLDGRGQSFSCSANATLSYIEAYLDMSAGATGSLTAYIYAHSGVYGTSSVPTGSPLATSNAVTVDSTTFPVANTNYLITFTFPLAQQINLVSGTDYVLVLKQSPAPSSATAVYWGADTTSPTAAGNACTYNTSTSSWSADATKDQIFYVYGTSSANNYTSNQTASQSFIGAQTKQINKILRLG